MEKPKVTILVIDDEKIIHESCGRVLQEEGFEVETALSGQEALEKLKKKRYNLVLSDIKMPGMNGIELLDKVKTEYPDTIVIIAVVLSTDRKSISFVK